MRRYNLKLSNKEQMNTLRTLQNAIWNSKNWEDLPEIKDKPGLDRDHGLDYSYHLTTDDWHPNFNGGLVACIICKYPDNLFAKIVIRGADDTVMAKKCNSYEEARDIVKRFPIIITFDYLFSIGFIWD